MIDYIISFFISMVPLVEIRGAAIYGVTKGLDIRMPINYYPDDDPANKPALQWRSHANILYTNWINYYVYQNTPYQWGQILDEEKRKLASKGLTQQCVHTK